MACVVHDTFTGSDGANLNARTGEIGATWTKHGSYAGNLLVQSNRIYCSTSPCGYYASGTPPTPDCDLEATLYNHSNIAGRNVALAARINTGANTMYLLDESDGTTWRIAKLVAGVFTTIASYAQTLSNTTAYVARFALRATSLIAWIDGTERINTTDADITAAGRVGLRYFATQTTTTGLHADDLRVTDLRGNLSLLGVGI